MAGINKGTPIYIGIDIGTSGIRACAIDHNKQVLASCTQNLPATEQIASRVQQDPQVWKDTLLIVMQRLGREIDLQQVVALAVDGTSGTVLLTDDRGNPVSSALMYIDARADEQVKQLRTIAPTDSPVNALTAGLPKVLWLAEHTDHAAVHHIMHQADWITFQFTGQAGHSDVNNCLKTGYDPVNRAWPDWIEMLDIPGDWFPIVHNPGDMIGPVSPKAAELFGLSTDTMVVSGTTDSHAAFVATGAARVGDAVTSLGSTLVTKVISDKPIFYSEHGVYSQPFGKYWLVGGASNTGGAVLRHYFSDEKMWALSEHINPLKPTGLDYYPLLKPGERFPVNDPELPPRMTPRPENEAIFFQAILEGIANIEHSAYQLLAKLGAPYPNSVRTVGGGAINEKWTQIRARTLDVDMLSTQQTEAAYGSALIAKRSN